MSDSAKLSGAIIAFNEESNIERCIESLQKVVDDIVVVDSGSTDKTIELAAKSGARVFHREFDNYINQKNYAADLSQHQYVISLDADEALSDELQKSILEEKKGDFRSSAYKMSCRNRYCGEWIFHGGWYPNQKVRLWNREIARWGGPTPHEVIEFSDAGVKVEALFGDILHYTYESVDEHLVKSRMYAELAAKQLAHRSFPYLFMKMTLSPSFKFAKNLFFRKGFADGWRGYNIAKVAWLETFWKYRQAWLIKSVKS